MFRFIEFWMGICYIQSNQIDTTLTSALESSLQSSSLKRSKEDNEETNDFNDGANATLKHVSSQDTLPPWLQDHGKPK